LTSIGSAKSLPAAAPADHRDGIAADVEDAAAAERLLKEPPLGVEACVEAEGRPHSPYLADGAALDEFHQPPDLRVAAVHERLHQKDVGLPGGVDDSGGLRVVDRQGLLAQDVLAGPGGLDRPLGVQGVRRGDVNGLDEWVGAPRR
jgi:hypothetical protein